MDEAFLFGGLVLFIVFGPWILVWTGRRRRIRERAEDQARWSELTHRVYALEEAVRQRTATQPPATEKVPSPKAPLAVPGPTGRTAHPLQPEPSATFLSDPRGRSPQRFRLRRFRQS